MTTSVAEEVRNAASVGDNRTHFNRESREDEHSDGKAPVAKGRVSSKKPIYYGCGQENE